MRKLFVVLFVLAAAFAFAQQNPQKYALVIGNGAYTGLGRLNNPVNDANDIEAALKSLGFSVEKLINADRILMQAAVTRLKNNLSKSKNTYGFFYYAGHGVQSAGVNYLIPVNADIPNEDYLQDRALPVQAMLRELNSAGNELNMIVLDACRNNPFSWGRSGSRGLAVVNAPVGSIVVFATDANAEAADGTGRNGLFTSQLLKNLTAPGLDVSEIFRKTGQDVIDTSGGKQHPEISIKYFKTAYLRPAQPAAPPPTPPPAVFETGAASVATGSLEISTVTAGTVRISGGVINQSVDLSAWGSLPIKKINAGTYRVTMRYTDGKTEEKTVEVGRAQEVKLDFSYRPPQPAPVVQPTPAPTVQPPATSPAAAGVPERPTPNNMVRINGGTFQMGSNNGDSDEKPVHTVTVSSFYMGKYEVTQKEWREVMGTNPSRFKGDNLPMETVSWFDAVEYCNKRSQREGLTPAYTISGSGNNRTVTWNRNASGNAAGYRLPTEAEWEYAAKGGNGSPGNYTYAGSNIAGQVAWHRGNSGSKTHNVGSKKPNGLGLYDMSGNVWEWCWDWYGNYPSDPQTDPMGASSGSYRVIRGGYWFNSAEYVRSAVRILSDPSLRYYSIGFRLVRP